MHVIEAYQLREKLSLSVLIDVDEGLFYRLRDGIFLATATSILSRYLDASL